MMEINVKNITGSPILIGDLGNYIEAGETLDLCKSCSRSDIEQSTNLISLLESSDLVIIVNGQQVTYYEALEVISTTNIKDIDDMFVLAYLVK